VLLKVPTDGLPVGGLVGGGQVDRDEVLAVGVTDEVAQ